MAARIIHVPRRFVSHEWGGTETVITEIARQQKQAGFEPRIITSMALAHEAHEIIQGIEVQRHRHCYPFFGLTDAEKAALDKKGGNLLSLPLFGALMREQDVRLFHAHSLKRLGGMVATAARLRRKPLVVSLHGGVFDVPAEEMQTMIQPISGKFEWGRLFGAVFRSRQLLDDADMIICVGQSELEAAQKKLQHNRIDYLPNGVESHRFTQGEGARFRAAHGIPQDAFLVMNISRIDAQKNQMVLVNAFSDLAKEDASAHLVLIGPETQPDYAAKLRARIAELGLATRIHLLPGLRNDDPALLDAYQACNVFVLPSMHEPFGIVVLEAWSAGKPVIASHVGGLKTLINHQRDGLFFHDEADLTAALRELKAHPERCLALGQAGQMEARTHYDWKRIHQRLETLYQQAEEHHNGRYRSVSAPTYSTRHV
ncbi:Glycosyltransferase involved in cell wall bisynthesis [Prosthecobacter debontii]|uniref:Glycosyltransferase involved in cell wall bisynthesis n=1 Tax=Prosthecobacter debontii TaxID=48467 RepID=A0A1T4XUK4_9BACT|nr:glycosyltransferase family 4 protein [Prosthecobacter debontii]SKA93184.1 Glycosyltransferase involved in cell wall bisynthesis [Prosthecobacter debontii]